MTSIYWPDKYVEKRKTAADAIKMIRSGQRVFIGSYCGEPQHLTKTLVEHASDFSDLEIIRLMSMENSEISRIAGKEQAHNFHVRSFYYGSSATKSLAVNKRFTTPMYLYDVPKLFEKRRLPLHAAMIQVSPPDDFGWMSLGVSVDVTLAAAMSADIVIAQVNSEMPRVHGRSIIHVNDVDVIVEKDEELITVEGNMDFKGAYPMAIPLIARLAANLIEDGSTIQFDLGITPKALTLAMKDKNDLGIHTQFLTKGVMDLVSLGVITNRYKGHNDGKIVASNAIGARNLYEFINNNPSIEFHASDYVNNPGVIARHNKMVAVNIAMNMDLMGQVSADALPQNHYSGVTGMIDFVRGAALSPGGKSIILMPSTSIDGTKSRIVPELPGSSVVLPKGDSYFVISEFGAVNMFGKNLQERAMAMISLAHPDFRDELLQQAKDKGLMDKTRNLNEFLFGVYPAKVEETRKYGDQRVTFRAVKAVDDRRIQEHFYSMNEEDVASRFFHVRKSFFRDDVENMFQVDYVNAMTVVAITGEFGFGKIIGIGEYMRENNPDNAEVAFSVSREWRGKGIADVIFEKLIETAKENDIKRLIAYTSVTNKGMVRLFKRRPYKIETRHEDDIYVMICDLTQPEEKES